MRVSIRSLVCGVLAFGIGLASLLGLLADLVSVDLSLMSLVDTRYNSISVIGENGFQVFDFKSALFDGTTHREWVVYLSAAISILQCVVGVAAIVVGACSVAFKNCETAARALIISCLVALMLYMVCGILYVSQFKELLCESIAGEEYEDYKDQIMEAMEQMFPMKTLAYLPLIFGVLFTIAYFVCAKMVPDIRLAGGYYRQDVERIQQKAARKNMYGMPNEETSAAYGPQCDRMPNADPAGAPVPPVPPVPPYAQNTFVSPPAPYGQNSFVPPVMPYGQNPFAPPVNAAPATEEEKMKLLQKYAAFHKEGIITDEEFEAKKKELLGI